MHIDLDKITKYAAANKRSVGGVLLTIASQYRIAATQPGMLDRLNRLQQSLKSRPVPSDEESV